MRQEKSATRVIALEEHFLHPKLWDLLPAPLQQQFVLVRDSLGDVGSGGRVRRMDAAGIDMQVLSHQPGVQFIDDSLLAIRLCREINDWLAEAIRKYPSRLAGFAMLPTQSPKDAADELERTVTQLGFKGALINGHTNGRYMDDESFGVLLERAQALGVPIYIHPADPPQPVIDTYYPGYPAMVIGWGWSVETGTHVLRMICGGVFDRYPRLKIIVGHMGELLPYCLTRLNIALTVGDWMLGSQTSTAVSAVPRKGMEKNVSYYMRQNVFVTSSGVFDQPVFNCAVSVLGIDNLLFSVDDPLRDNFEAMEFLSAAQLSTDDRDKFAHGNAERLLKLPTATGASVSFANSPLERLRSSTYAFRAKTVSKLGRAIVSSLLK